MTQSPVVPPTLLIVAKSPVAGFAKTRIAATTGDTAAARVAGAALLDTMVTAAAVGWPVVVAMTGQLAEAAFADEIEDALSRVSVIEQRGDTFGQRLANAHVDADAGHGVVQIGMDTPHVTVRDLMTAGELVGQGLRTIGPAEDGGWWLLGLPEPREAAQLADVVMSRDDTGSATISALGGDLAPLRVLRDMDTWDDARAIAELIPLSRLARVVASLAVSA